MPLGGFRGGDHDCDVSSGRKPVHRCQLAAPFAAQPAAPPDTPSAVWTHLEGVDKLPAPAQRQRLISINMAAAPSLVPARQSQRQAAGKAVAAACSAVAAAAEEAARDAAQQRRPPQPAAIVPVGVHLPARPSSALTPQQLLQLQQLLHLRVMQAHAATPHSRHPATAMHPPAPVPRQPPAP